MKEVIDSIQAAIQDCYNLQLESIELTRPSQPKFGDFSTNVSFALAEKVGQSPREIATVLTAKLQETKPQWLASVDIAGPGFINLFVGNDYLLKLLVEPYTKPFAGKTVVIETNNPNPFKDIHIGHTMNAIVADTIANLLEAGGAQLHRVSYHGDVGLHVGKGLWAILDELSEDTLAQLEAIKPAERTIKLREWYARGSKAYDESEAAKAAIEELTKQTFNFTDPKLQQIYELCKEWSFDYFDQVFSSIGCKPVEQRYLESQSDKQGREIVEAHLGDVFESSQGAIIFPGERYGLHNRVFIASRGTTLYEARDLGLMALKEEDYHPDKSYIVTAEEQKEYFRVVFKAASLALPELKDKTVNIATGMVKLTTGKMSSRTGDVVNVSWLLDNLHNEITSRGANETNIDQITVGALRYSFLRNRLTSDTVFDIEQSVSVEGNTGPYLQYAHARACSILKKASNNETKVDPASIETDERTLLSKLSEFNMAVDTAIRELMPHHVATYLHELCREFNVFYEKNRIIGDDREAQRLAILKQYTEVLRNGLELLGIPAPETV